MSLHDRRYAVDVKLLWVQILPGINPKIKSVRTDDFKSRNYNDIVWFNPWTNIYIYMIIYILPASGNFILRVSVEIQHYDYYLFLRNCIKIMRSSSFPETSKQKKNLRLLIYVGFYGFRWGFTLKIGIFLFFLWELRVHKFDK